MAEGSGIRCVAHMRTHCEECAGRPTDIEARADRMLDSIGARAFGTPRNAARTHREALAESAGNMLRFIEREAARFGLDRHVLRQQIFCAAVAYAKTERGVSQASIGRRASYSRCHVTDMLKGRRTITDEALAAALLETPPSFLFDFVASLSEAV